jgi:3-dehydroquinate dehydratase
MKILVNNAQISTVGNARPHNYVKVTYAQLEEYIREQSPKKNTIEVELFQSNQKDLYPIQFRLLTRK